MSKRVSCKFIKPLSWKDALLLGLDRIGSVVYLTAGGSNTIDSFRCEVKDFEKISSHLGTKKVAFKKDE